jgi:hypothetical protein
MFAWTMLALGLAFLAFAMFVLTMRRFRRRRQARPLPPKPRPTAFDMPQLRAMRDAGAITKEEFERLREVNFRKSIKA